MQCGPDAGDGKRRRRVLMLSNQISSDTFGSMKTLTVTEVARNFNAVMDSVESEQEDQGRQAKAARHEHTPSDATQAVAAHYRRNWRSVRHDCGKAHSSWARRRIPNSGFMACVAGDSARFHGAH